MRSVDTIQFEGSDTAVRWEEESALVSSRPCIVPLRSPRDSPHDGRVEVVSVQTRRMVVESNADEQRRIAQTQAK